MEKFIVRTKNAGVFFGEILSKTSTEIEMANFRKLWYWDGACSIEQLAVDGTSAPQNCKFTITVEKGIVIDPIQIIPCTERSIKSIENVKEWKR